MTNVLLKSTSSFAVSSGLDGTETVKKETPVHLTAISAMNAEPSGRRQHLHKIHKTHKQTWGWLIRASQQPIIKAS